MKKALIQLHVAVFLAGFTAILGVFIHLNEGLLVWYRLAISVFVLFILQYAQRTLEKLSIRQILELAGVGVIVAIHWVTFYGSVKYANVSVALVCFSATSFFTALFEPVILKRKFIFAEVLFGLMAVVGIYIIFDFHPQYKMGIVFGIISAMGCALFPIFNKNFIERYRPKTIMLYEFGGGLLALTILLPFYFQSFSAAYFFPTLTDWAWLILLALVCTVFSFELQTKALKKVSAFTANLTYNLEPVYGILLAFIFFKENKQLNPSFYLGLALIMLAILMQMVRLRLSHKFINKL